MKGEGTSELHFSVRIFEHECGKETAVVFEQLAADPNAEWKSSFSTYRCNGCKELITPTLENTKEKA